MKKTLLFLVAASFAMTMVIKTESVVTEYDLMRVIALKLQEKLQEEKCREILEKLIKLMKSEDSKRIKLDSQMFLQGEMSLDAFIERYAHETGEGFILGRYVMLLSCDQFDSLYDQFRQIESILDKLDQ